MKGLWEGVKKNVCKAGRILNIPSENFKYYEDLRNYALGERTSLVMPLGLDLFIKKGSKAWLSAWTEHKTSVTGYSIPVQANSEHATIPIPQVIQPEITRILANMILSYGGMS